MKPSPILTGETLRVYFIGAVRQMKKKPPVPSMATCDSSVERILKAHQLWLNQTSDLPDLGEARNPALGFLKHLPAARTQTINLHAKAAGIPAIQADYDNVLAAMRAAEDAVRKLLEASEWKTQPKHSWHELAHHVRACVVLAWCETGISLAEVPSSVNANDPLCSIVTAILGRLLGEKQSNNTVSSVLQGKRGGPTLSREDKTFFRKATQAAVKQYKTKKYKCT